MARIKNIIFCYLIFTFLLFVSGCKTSSQKVSSNSFVPTSSKLNFSQLTVEDKITGVMWTRDANLGGKEMSKDETDSFITRLRNKKYAGCSNWRFPTVQEFASLMNYAATEGAKKGFNEILAKKGFNNVQTNYWISTKIFASFNLFTGSLVLGGDNYSRHYVWPVCSSQ